MNWIDLFGNVLLKSPIGILVASLLCMLHDLTFNARQHELAAFGRFLHFLAYKCFLNQVRLPYESSQLALTFVLIIVLLYHSCQ